MARVIHDRAAKTKKQMVVTDTQESNFQDFLVREMHQPLLKTEVLDSEALEMTVLSVSSWCSAVVSH